MVGWVSKLPGLQGWCKDCFGKQRCLGATCRHTIGDGEEWCHFLFSHYGFGTMVDLQRHLKHERRIVQLESLCLELQMDGVVTG